METEAKHRADRPEIVDNGGRTRVNPNAACPVPTTAGVLAKHVLPCPHHHPHTYSRALAAHRGTR